jgi:hypothetical protein
MEGNRMMEARIIMKGGEMIEARGIMEARGM